MLKLLCYILLFFSISQPVIFFPELVEYRPFFVLASFTTLFFFIRKISNKKESVKLQQNIFIYGILIAYTLSEAQYLWLEGTLNVFLFWFKKVLLYYLFINIMNDIKDIKRLIWATTLAVVSLASLGWDTYLYHPEFFKDNINRLQSFGNYNNPNSFALLLTMAFPLTFSLMEVEKGLKKILLLAFLFTFVISVFYTKSRGGAFGMFVGIILSIMWSSKALKTKVLKVFFAGIFTIVFISYGVHIILDRPDVVAYFGGHGESSSGDRLLAWIAAVRMFLDYPIIGVGWERFTEYVRNYGLDKKLIAHNTMLSVLAETGIVGFVFFMSIIITTFKQLWTIKRCPYLYKDIRDLRIINNGILISLIAFIVNTSFSVKDYEPMYWALLSLTGVVYVLYRNVTAPLKNGLQKDVL